jgi:hypothetical protein
MTRWIENVAGVDVQGGYHTDMGSNALLIQIGDPATFFPIPKHDFKVIVHYEFLDAEDEDDYPDEAKISDEDAASIVEWLKYAQENHMNVLVHCFAGICRSGAVVEVGESMGFTGTGRFREPNQRVLRKMQNYLKAIQ